MKRRGKLFLIIGISLGVLLILPILLLQSDTAKFLALQAAGIRNAGTWEDDPQNWYRAFRTNHPAEVTIHHSKYWRSSHFTEEFIYYFEIEATPAWRDAFLKEHQFSQVPASEAWSFRSGTSDDMVPTWFAPDPVELYDVWDKNRYHGSIWINKTNGHIFFFDAKL